MMTPNSTLCFKRLDLEIPAAANPAGWVDSLRLMRLYRAKSGVIEINVLRGGMIEFFEGPWRIVDNDFRGTPPGTIPMRSSQGMASTTSSCVATRPEATAQAARPGDSWS